MFKYAEIALITLALSPALAPRAHAGPVEDEWNAMATAVESKFKTNYVETCSPSRDQCTFAIFWTNGKGQNYAMVRMTFADHSENLVFCEEKQCSKIK